MSEIILQAGTLAELRTKLAELDIDVPARSEGRRNHHAERYCIAHLLATLPAERLSFPLTLVHSDKPDFVLTMSGTEVGIEHTEAVPENVARANFLREKGLGPRGSTLNPDFRPFSESAFSTGAGLTAVIAKVLWWHVCNSHLQT
ncbi:hypothetical protein QX25_06690 [Stutzerimonas stutzeri]|nr:hypothetical protein QX25_06690 [Stutzerimonas stutzeri]